MPAPNDSVILSGKIGEIYNKGIPIVLIDTIINTDSYDVYCMTDNLMAGQNAAEEMISLLRKNGTSDSDSIQIGIQVGATSSLTIIERLAGFLQYWSKNAPPSWEVLPDIKCNEGSVDKAVECAEELLKYPGLKGVFGTNNGSTVGFAKVVREQERKDIALVGFDYSEEIAELINSDEYIASTILQKQYNSSLNEISSSFSFFRMLVIYLVICGVGVSVLFVRFDGLIRSHDKKLTGNICSLVTEKMNNSIRYMTHAAENMAAGLSAQDIDDL